RAAAIADRIAELDEVTRRIDRTFEPSGEISDRASDTLFELRERTRGLHRGIKAKLDQLLHTDEFVALLRENYFTIRNERYVVPVVANHRGQVPGIVHNASQSGQTLFIEPEPLIGLGNELAIAQSMVHEEERRILLEVSGTLGAHAAEIGDSLDAVAELDGLEAAARLAADLHAHAPELVGGDAPFTLKGMRHPLLVLQGKQVVPNDASLADGQRVLVISGPNAGGKTVTMTGIGLAALMLRAGLPVPCERGSTLPFFKRVMTAVGDKQDLSKDLSTFSAHLTALNEITRTATHSSLVLIDEIAADTDPREGAAIALAVLEDLARKGARVLVTTHLEELKAVALTDPHYVNARVEFDAQRLAPTYRVQYGTPGSSSAIEIARRVGLDLAICARAEENLKGATGPLGVALQKLEAESAAAGRARRELE
ncbi:MAG: endonuclease MutS2, partial [Myxococcales bacterium]